MFLRLLIAAGLLAGAACGGPAGSEAGPADASGRIALPAPALDGAMSVEAALAARRSVRSYADAGLTLAEAGQLLWAAYGVTKPMPEARATMRGGYRTAPSAGAAYPLDVYLVAGRVEGLEPGLYRYLSDAHELEQVSVGDFRAELSAAARNQAWVREAPLSVFWSWKQERLPDRYGTRGRERYLNMDLGHSAQNVYLQAVALGLGTVAVGAFDDAEVGRVIGLAEGEEPLYIMPVGRLAADQPGSGT